MKYLIIILCMVLLPAVMPGQSTYGQQLMQLVRLYEQAQDSVFLPDNNARRVALLENCLAKADHIRAEMPSTVDSATIRVANYLHTALIIYANTAGYSLQKDSITRTRLLALRAVADTYTSTDFPLRFNVMGITVVLRYEDVAPDLHLYYSTIAPLCSCAELRLLISHLKKIQENELAGQYKKGYWRKCH